MLLFFSFEFFSNGNLIFKEMLEKFQPFYFSQFSLSCFGSAIDWWNHIHNPWTIPYCYNDSIYNDYIFESSKNFFNDYSFVFLNPIFFIVYNLLNFLILVYVTIGNSNNFHNLYQIDNHNNLE